MSDQWLAGWTAALETVADHARGRAEPWRPGGSQEDQRSAKWANAIRAAYLDVAKYADYLRKAGQARQKTVSGTCKTCGTGWVMTLAADVVQCQCEKASSEP